MGFFIGKNYYNILIIYKHLLLICFIHEEGNKEYE